MLLRYIRKFGILILLSLYFLPITNLAQSKTPTTIYHRNTQSALKKTQSTKYKAFSYQLTSDGNTKEVEDVLNHLTIAPHISIFGISSTPNTALEVFPFEKLVNIKHLVLKIYDQDDITEVWKRVANIKNLECLEVYGQVKNGTIDFTPEFIYICSKLRVLKVYGLDINETTKVIDTDLRILELDLHRNNIGNDSAKHFLDFFTKSNKLKSLKINFRGTAIIEDFKSLSKFQELEKFNFSASNHDEPSSLLSHLSCFETLKFLKYRIGATNEKFTLSPFENLEHINIFAQSNTTILSELQKLKKLKYLSLDVATVSEKIFDTVETDSLTISYTTILDSEEKLNSVSKLKYLKYVDCYPNKLPESIFSTKTLKSLIIKSTATSIDKVDERIAELEDLESIVIENYSSKRFPSLTELKKLRTLNLKSSNIFDKYEDSIKVKTTSKIIEELDFDVHEIELFKLDGFPISDTLLTQLFQKITTCRSNLELSLVGCQISQLPKIKWELVKLKELELRLNPIRTIPNDFFKAKINKLDITNEYIDSKDGEFRRLNDFKLYGLFNNFISIEEAIKHMDFSKLSIDESTECSQLKSYTKNYDFVRPSFTQLISEAIKKDTLFKSIRPSVLGNYYFDVGDFINAKLELEKACNSVAPYAHYCTFNNQLNKTWVRLLLTKAYLNDLTLMKDLENIGKEIKYENADINYEHTYLTLAILYNSISEKNLGQYYATRTIERIKKGKKLQQLDTRSLLSITLAYFLTNQKTNFIQSLDLLAKSQSNSIQPILNYFTALKNLDSKLDFEESLKHLNPKDFKTWDTYLIDIWGFANKNERIAQLNSHIKPNRKFLSP